MKEGIWGKKEREREILDFKEKYFIYSFYSVLFYSFCSFILFHLLLKKQNWRS